MNFPIKCFTCNKLLAHLKPVFDENVKKYKDELNEKSSEFRAFTDINIPLNKYCCRNILMTSVKINFN